MASPPDDSGSKAARRDDSTTDDRPDLIANHVLDVVSDSVIVLSPDWRFTYVNRAALERAGLRREQVIGRSLWELRSASPVDFQRVRAAAAEGKPFHFELQRADFGLVQLCNLPTNVLTLVAQRGFTQDSAQRFHTIDDASTACGRAMLRRERVIIEDVESESAFEPYRPIAEQVDSGPCNPRR